MAHKSILSILLVCLLFSCKKNAEHKSEETYDWATNSMISHIVDSLRQTKGTFFITIRFYPRNDSNYIVCFKSILKAPYGEPHVAEYHAFAGYTEIDSTALLVFWNYCEDSIFHKFVQHDKLSTNVERYDSLVKILNNKHINLRLADIDGLTKTIFLIDENDSLVLFKEECLWD